MTIPSLDFDPYADAALAGLFAWHDHLREAGPLFFLPRYGC